MALPATRGSTLITRTSAARAGQYIDITQAEIDLVNIEGLLLWLDAKSLLAGSTTALRDRLAALAGTVDNGVALAGSGGSKDNLGFVFPALPDNQQRLAVPTFAMPSDYTAVFVINPANGTTASAIRVLLYELPNGEYLQIWLEQPAVDGPLTLRARHGSTGGLNLIGVIPHSTRSILTVNYDPLRTRMSAFLGKTLLGAITENAKDAAVGTWFGGRPGVSNPTHKFSGMIEAVIILGGLSFYSADATSPANARRNALIDAVAAVYGL
ncbi:hypothetical protein [Sphingobium sp. WCS2017Hpa-17]|uniref:hypothetical protein n=1 Tax=Sphingobium sp. WCS2017Hpa-17 TaxID=3073638 RepID=UPI0028895C3B|nr:hypothetical protein [Sphingobium sp. WCS2017Hpa-17]